LLTTGEPTADTLQMGRPAKHPEWDGEGRIQLVEVPAQPLLGSAPLVDEIVAVIDEQLQVTEDLLVGPRPAQVGLAQRSPGDGERVDRVRLPTRSARASLRPSASAVPAPDPRRA
jgi:hypothetical protein